VALQRETHSLPERPGGCPPVFLFTGAEQISAPRMVGVNPTILTPLLGAPRAPDGARCGASWLGAWIAGGSRAWVGAWVARPLEAASPVARRRFARCRGRSDGDGEHPV